jgi:hypothetical protein
MSSELVEDVGDQGVVVIWLTGSEEPEPGRKVCLRVHTGQREGVAFAEGSIHESGE